MYTSNGAYVADAGWFTYKASFDTSNHLTWIYGGATTLDWYRSRSGDTWAPQDVNDTTSKYMVVSIQYMSVD